MQVNQGLTTTVVTPNGKKETISATTANFDQLQLNKEGKRSIEYARARTAINEDYKNNFKSNQALAKRVRKACKEVVVEVLEGKVSTKVDEKTKEKKILVTFPDHSVARL